MELLIFKVKIESTFFRKKTDCDHTIIEHDHSADLVGTWTYMDEDFAEALVISADGSVVSTRLFLNEYRENIKGKIVVENGDVNLTFEDGGNFKSHFDIIPGMAFTIFNEEGERLTYNYCKEDLSDEIVGMWVCNDGPMDKENEIMIRTYDENGKVATTGVLVDVDANPILNSESNYKVIGDLVFKEFPKDIADKTGITHNAERLIYTPKATAAGDIMTILYYLPVVESNVEMRSSYLRIKEGLNLTNKLYAYNTAYVSNAKGADEDFTMLGHTFNMANINAGNFDMMFRSELFCVDLNANSITQHFLPANGQDVAIEIPITVEGNKVTLDLSTENPAYRKVDMYMFQDADDSQLHMYMHTDAFINYFANMELYNLLASGEIDKTDAAAIEKVYTDMEARIESINVSFVMKARK